jgi:hypothetical protein
VQAVVSHPSIAASAAVAPDALSRPRTAHVETPAGRVNPSYRFVSPEYFGVLDIPVLRGRTFTIAESEPGHALVIVAETLARQLWPGADAIGQTLSLGVDEAMQRREEPALPGRTFAVVGVVGDVAGFRLAEFPEASLYFPINAAAAETSLTVRAHGDPELARRRLLERLTPIDPNMGQVMTFRTLARLETYMLQVAFWVAVVLGGLALALTLSGLFSVLSYLVEQRTPEIGVRMALGATAGGVARLVLAQSVRPVALGLLVGGGLAASLAGVLLATPLAASIGRSVKLLDPIAYAASLSCIVAACLVAAGVPALRAARIDPMVTLRHD